MQDFLEVESTIAPSTIFHDSTILRVKVQYHKPQ